MSIPVDNYVNKPHPGVWRAGLLQIVLVAIFSALLALLASVLPVGLDRITRGGVGLVLAFAPALIWIYFFYRQDRLEPEPKVSVAQVFLLAMVLTQAVGIPLLRDLLAVGEWAVANDAVSLPVSILAFGVVYQTIAYVAVRAVVYNTHEFDERMDGIVYGTVAGLGVATLINLRFVTGNDGVELLPAVVRTATTTLAMASFSGLMGHMMAEAKFGRRPFWWCAVGVALAALLNGLFSWLISEASVTGLTVDPWRSLGLGIVVALATFVVVMWLISRVVPVSLRRS